MQNQEQATTPVQTTTPTPSVRTPTFPVDRATFRDALKSIEILSKDRPSGRTSAYVDLSQIDGKTHLELPGVLSILINDDARNIPAFRFLIELKEIKKALTGIKGKTVDLTVTGSKLQIGVCPVSVLTEVTDRDTREAVLTRQKSWTKPPYISTDRTFVERLRVRWEDFHRGLVQSSASKSDEPTRYSMAGLELEKVPEPNGPSSGWTPHTTDFLLMTTDGRRLTATGSKDWANILPLDKVDQIPVRERVLEVLESWKVANDDLLTVKIHMGSRTEFKEGAAIEFRTATHSLLTSVGYRRVPDWRQVIPSGGCASVTVDCDTLERAIAQLKPVWSAGEMAIVTLSENQDGGLDILAGSHGSTETATVTIPVVRMKWDFRPISFNPRFLADLTVPKSLRTRPVDLTLEIHGKDIPAVATTDFDPNTRKVLMPVIAK